MQTCYQGSEEIPLFRGSEGGGLGCIARLIQGMTSLNIYGKHTSMHANLGGYGACPPPKEILKIRPSQIDILQDTINISLTVVLG